MAIPESIAQAKQIDVSDLVGRHIGLRRVAGHEWQGPCPKCGGSDRLHCSADWWFCRQCHTKRGDAIDFLRFATGCTFQAAVEQLTNQRWPERLKPALNPQPRGVKVDDRDATWFEDAAKMLKLHQLKLPGSEGAEYLRGRGLTPATWAAFGLGFAHTMNRDANRELPAIAMPWYRSGKITAIRYRFLYPTGKQKISSLPGSKFGSALFGSQGLPEWVTMAPDEGRKGAEQFCTLILCEGEINAMSIWQVAHGTNLHVMSVGSETGRLSAGAVTFAERYGRVIIWLDREDLVKQVREQIPGSYGFASPNGKDANDLLLMGKLGGQLVAVRWQAARSDDEKHRLFWDLWDCANEGDGLEPGTAAAYRKLCEPMARDFDLVESQPGLWTTARREPMAA